MIKEEQTHRNFLRRDRENRCFMTFPNTTEAMKMETSVVARMDGTIDEVFVKGGQSVKAGELLLTIK